MRKYLFSIVACLSMLGVAPSAFAVVADLTTAGATATIGDAFYQQISPSSTGTGVIDSFVQLSGAGNLDQTEAYNTTTNNTLNNGSAANFNHSILLGSVPVLDPVVIIGGDEYRQFLLDVNEDSGKGREYISLDEVQIFVGGTANSGVETFTSGVLDHDGDLVYRLDDGADNTVLLNYALNHGSGSGDMFLYVLASLFDGYADTDVVTLYSHFGAYGDVDTDGDGKADRDYNVSDGFEEWAVLLEEGTPDPDVPEPASIVAWLVCSSGLGLVLRSRLKKAAA